MILLALGMLRALGFVLIGIGLTIPVVCKASPRPMQLFPFGQKTVLVLAREHWMITDSPGTFGYRPNKEQVACFKAHPTMWVIGGPGIARYQALVRNYEGESTLEYKVKTVPSGLLLTWCTAIGAILIATTSVWRKVAGDIMQNLCLICRYPLHGLPTNRCPECGSDNRTIGIAGRRCKRMSLAALATLGLLILLMVGTLGRPREWTVSERPHESIVVRISSGRGSILRVLKATPEIVGPFPDVSTLPAGPAIVFAFPLWLPPFVSLALFFLAIRRHPSALNIPMIAGSSAS
jgi:hypothetical protein